MRNNLRYLALAAFAAPLTVACHHKDDDKIYMEGNLNPGIPAYKVCGTAVIGHTGGITTPSTGVKYYWTNNYNTKEEASASSPTPHDTVLFLSPAYKLPAAFLGTSLQKASNTTS